MDQVDSQEQFCPNKCPTVPVRSRDIMETSVVMTFLEIFMTVTKSELHRIGFSEHKILLFGCQIDSFPCLVTRSMDWLSCKTRGAKLHCTQEAGLLRCREWRMSIVSQGTSSCWMNSSRLRRASMAVHTKAGSL